MPMQPPLRDATRYPVASLIALASIAVSIWWWAGHGIDHLVPRTGWLVREPWTLLTSIFPHVNVLHLFFNLSWWWMLGARVEMAFGGVRTLGIVAVLAVVGGAAEFAFGSTGVGLSGVVYGVCALVWSAQRGVTALRGVVGQRTINLFAAWFVLCIVLTVTKVMPIANFAHAAGALAGWMLGRAIAAEGSRARGVGALAGGGGGGGWVGAVGGVVVLVGVGATVGRPYVNIRMLLMRDSYMGYRALEEHRYAEAARYLEAAIKRRPGHADEMANLGSAYMGLGRYADALGMFTRASEADPTLTRGLQGSIGVAELKLGRLDGAIRWLESAARTEPVEATTCYNLGIAYARKGRHADSLVEYKRAVAIDGSHRGALTPAIVSILDNQAAALIEKGDASGARALLDEALGWDPKDEYAKRTLEWMESARPGSP